MKNTQDVPTGNIVIYKDPKGQLQLEVKLERESVWLSQNQIAKLFNTDRTVISRHLQNIFKSGELEKLSNVQKMHVAFSDRPVEFYNLDCVISVGYRVNSKRATGFRIWATNVLRSYLLEGYAVNQKRLLEQKEKFLQLQRTIRFLTEKSKAPLLEDRAGELFRLLDNYTNSLSLLFQYDEGKVKLYKKQKARFILTYEIAWDIIVRIAAELQKKGEAGTLFGQEYENKLKSIIGTIYQTFDKKELYKTVEEKAANILYLIIKDHPFADGNKRIGSLLFVYFLDKNNYLLKDNFERKIPDTTLVALALLIAESKPSEKDVMVNLVTNLLRD